MEGSQPKAVWLFPYQLNHMPCERENDRVTNPHHPPMHRKSSSSVFPGICYKLLFQILAYLTFEIPGVIWRLPFTTIPIVSSSKTLFQ